MSGRATRLTERTKNRIVLPPRTLLDPIARWGIAMRERMVRLQDEEPHSPCWGPGAKRKGSKQALRVGEMSTCKSHRLMINAANLN